MTIPRPRPPRRGRTPRRPGRAPASRARLAARAALAALAAAAALTAAAQPALAGTAGHVLAAASIDQVISNITKWIVGDPGRPGDLVPDPRRAAVPDGRRGPERGGAREDRAALRRHRLRAGDPGPRHRHRPEVPGRRMTRPALPAARLRRRVLAGALAAGLLAACAALTLAASPARAPARPAAAWPRSPRRSCWPRTRPPAVPGRQPQPVPRACRSAAAAPAAGSWT